MHSWYNTFQILATNRNGVMVMKIPLQQVIEAIEMADDAFTAFWDSKTGTKLDKDRFRRDMGGVEDAYQEIMKRLLGR